jgi:hypothetical protein
VKSSGNPFSIGSSVEPGLPNTVVIPWARQRSNDASRTEAKEARTLSRAAGRARAIVTSTGVTVDAKLV